MGSSGPDRPGPYRFHSIAGNNTVNKIAEVAVIGNVVLLYDSPTGETILPTDDWFKPNPSMNYPASIPVADIGEAIT